MTYTVIGRALGCLALGVALLATVVAFVPAPIQVLAALVVLPVESLLIAMATATRRQPADHTASQSLR
jgi:hypothetical protein